MRPRRHHEPRQDHPRGQRSDELTPRTGRVGFEIEAGTGRTSRRAWLADLGNALTQTETGFELNLGDGEQNAVIDRLRSAGIGIRSITPRKLSLEESFIDLVTEKRP